MKKTITFVALILFSANIFSQTHRFIYDFKYKVDTLDTEYDKQEMALDINPDEVKFYEYQFAVNDSLSRLPQHEYSQYTSQSQQTLKRKINTNNNLNYVQIMMMPYYYVYESNDPIKWKIENETKTLGSYKIQKATTYFGGRNWTAWFTPDIPISEGPYKFRGLPGLILAVEDSQQHFTYQLSRNVNFDKTYDTSGFLEKHYNLNALKINYKTWIKLNLEFYNDPYARMRAEFNPDWFVKINDRRIKSREEFYELTKPTQDQIRREYNPIERDKAIPYPKK
ncbi:GLPGLI family protein [Chryseobacterium sp. 2987]|uniref:GLPGLI family protein n=1 Tax=Chryseobacterium sp. 2987 TaxID=2817767 RepID=UPI00285888BE|nr:GLPGLI family protein [Chryseobacterium sp. 2987]MDR6920230.1 GLPGLI family protein [Chryseobacterium sp. 2987]